MRVRPLGAGDDEAIRRIFRSTVLLGRQLPFGGRIVDRYEALCLDWYLTSGRRDAAVVESDDGAIAGYALVCTDEDSFRSWNHRHAASYAVRSVPRALRRGDAASFVRLRLRDGWMLWRHGGTSPMPAHAHLNLTPAVRAGRAGRLLGDHIDACVRAAGLPGWYGEINAVVGRRALALERLGGEIVHRTPNHTLSAFAHQPIERLTVVRHLGSHDAAA
jgi:hypothetical protein